MKRLLSTAPLVVLALAAADTVLARRSVPHRPVEADLFVQAGLLWLVFVLLALLPAWLLLRVSARRRGDDLGAGLDDGRGDDRPGAVGAGMTLAFCAALPVVLHHALDEYTGSGQDVSHLKSAWPWLAAAGFAAGWAAVAWGLAKLLARAPGKPVAAAIALVSLVCGLFLPTQLEPPPVKRAPDVPGAPDATGKPNLLLLVWDTTRADHTGPYGYARDTTPHLARLAEESLVFEEARSATIFTFTSHLTMLTGVMPSVHGARLLSTRYDPRKATTIAEILREEGYRTGAFVGTDVLAGRTGIRHGFERYCDAVDPPVCDTHAWKLVHDVQSLLALRFRAFKNNGLPHWIQDFQRPAPDVLAEAREWIEQDDPRPWFCMINLYDVHWPYLPGPEARDVMVRAYNGAWDGYLFRSDAYVPGSRPDAEGTAHLRDLYDAEMLELDRNVAGFLEGLDLDRTGVLITSDHGEAFGEAGTWKHEDIFEPQLTIPFVVRLPGATRAGRVATRAAGMDVAPTLLGMAGVDIPEIVQGVDLSREVPDFEREIMVEDSDSMNPDLIRLALYRGRWKLCRFGKLDEYEYTLHDLSTDRVGEIDVSAQHPELKAELVARMVEIRGDVDRELSEQTYEIGSEMDAFQALGYAGDDD